MGLLQIVDQKPLQKISSKAVSPELCCALHEFFKRATPDSWLVGGTALTGYYAEHRLSHDMDIFVKAPDDFDPVCRAVKGLQRQGLSLTNEFHTPQYYRTQAVWRDYAFTIDIVLDENLHQVGASLRTADGLVVATLNTLFAMKFSTLVSRCSEKDLFDLKWFFSSFPEISISDAITNAKLIDGGISHETLLIGLSMAQPRLESCGFLLRDSAGNRKKILSDLVKFQRRLIRLIHADQKNAPVSSLADKLAKTVRQVKKI